MTEPMGKKERGKRVGDNLQDEPDAVDIKQPGEGEVGGVDIEETWHRTGSKPPFKAEAEKPPPPSESSEKQP